MRVSLVKNCPDFANETPSSEVKHWALEKLVSASTVTTPFGWMNSRPLVAPQRSTGTKTLVLGRKAAGRAPAGQVLPWLYISVNESLILRSEGNNGSGARGLAGAGFSVGSGG